MHIKKQEQNYAEYVLLLFGAFLVIDSFFLHLLTFNYTRLGLAWLDPWFNHWMVGVVFILIAYVGLEGKR